MNSLASALSLCEEDDALAVGEAIKMIKPIKTLNPAQARLAALKKQKDDLSKRIGAERDRQRLAKTQQQNFKAAH